ncbi:MAG: hypothetical protein BWK75_03365 [Candidatus Altiarchaeales archaeon A3]|nr:MAG: hypothetical protein BWK75_03365 [Candidatus Altiarchaeales archaeon A3]
MKYLTWKVKFGILLVVLSASVYFLHYLIFRDLHHIEIFMLSDIAFVFIEVLLVTLIIHALLDKREKHTKIKKMNSLIGAFFSEVGNDMLSKISCANVESNRIQSDLAVYDDWNTQNFIEVRKKIKSYDYKIDYKKIDFEHLNNFLSQKRDFLVRLLESPFVMEHENFTDMIHAVYHLTQELNYRNGFKNLPESDYEHLAKDIERAYVLLAHQWIDYMENLKKEYPYIFSLYMRTNPFNLNACPIVRK